jgi:hypothetical protein
MEQCVPDAQPRLPQASVSRARRAPTVVTGPIRTLYTEGLIQSIAISSTAEFIATGWVVADFIFFCGVRQFVNFLVALLLWTLSSACSVAAARRTLEISVPVLYFH